MALAVFKTVVGPLAGRGMFDSYPLRQMLYGGMKKKPSKAASPTRQEQIKAAIAGLRELRKRCILNPPGKPRLKIKDLINEGRP